MRIVSLLPSATELVCDLGLSEGGASGTFNLGRSPQRGTGSLWNHLLRLWARGECLSGNGAALPWADRLAACNSK